MPHLESNEKPIFHSDFSFSSSSFATSSKQTSTRFSLSHASNASSSGDRTPPIAVEVDLKDPNGPEVRASTRPFEHLRACPAPQSPFHFNWPPAASDSKPCSPSSLAILSSSGLFAAPKTNPSSLVSDTFKFSFGESTPNMASSNELFQPTVFKEGTNNVSFETITSRVPYDESSFEELRVSDYAKDKIRDNPNSPVPASENRSPAVFGASTGSPSNISTTNTFSSIHGDGNPNLFSNSWKSTKAMKVTTANTVDSELNRYIATLNVKPGTATDESDGRAEEIRTTPLFTWPVKLAASQPPRPEGTIFAPSRHAKVDFVQFGLLGSEVKSSEEDSIVNGFANMAVSDSVEPIFLNTNAPWSTFICGSQGSGKSHTMSTMLENCLLSNNKIGKLPKPLSGMVFHYDTHSFGHVCEAAYIASTGVSVRVLVSPSNLSKMKGAYNSLFGGKNSIQVMPLKLQPKHLNTERMLKLMAMTDSSSGMPLYMEVIIRILREMATGSTGFDYNLFLAQLKGEQFSRDQIGPLNMRLKLLESFVDMTAGQKPDIFACKPGSLTIVDLTDPFVDAGTACVLFEICIALFLEDKASATGRVIGLDEAHKYMNSSAASAVLTETLLTTIREQRHTASRVIISTQEPTISTSLLDLCSVTIVHRFTSPDWLATLRKHIAAASPFVKSNAVTETIDGDGPVESPNVRLTRIFDQIVTLRVGESLLFTPSSMLRVERGEPKKMGTAYIKMKTRPRLSADGGRSILAVRK